MLKKNHPTKREKRDQKHPKNGPYKSHLKSVCREIHSRRVIVFTGLFLVFLFSASCAGKRHPGIKRAPYTVWGKRYVPMTVEDAKGYEEVGVASWYGSEGLLGFGGKTANGERYGRRSLNGAHRTLPIPCVVRVTNLENRKTMEIRINDRGPFIDGRMLDVSARVARLLGFKDQGLTKVRIRVVKVGDD